MAEPRPPYSGPVPPDMNIQEGPPPTGLPPPPREPRLADRIARGPDWPHKAPARDNGRNWMFVSAALMIVVVVLGVLLATRGTGRKASETDPEVKWAKEIAEQFLTALADQNEPAMATFTARGFAPFNPRIDGPVRFDIESETLSPTRDEIAFKGTATLTARAQYRPFTLMMKREDGRWKVSSFVQGPPTDRRPGKDKSDKW